MSKCKQCCRELASYYGKRRREKRREAKAAAVQSEQRDGATWSSLQKEVVL